MYDYAFLKTIRVLFIEVFKYWKHDTLFNKNRITYNKQFSLAALFEVTYVVTHQLQVGHRLTKEFFFCQIFIFYIKYQEISI